MSCHKAPHIYEKEVGWKHQVLPPSLPLLYVEVEDIVVGGTLTLFDLEDSRRQEAT